MTLALVLCVLWLPVYVRCLQSLLTLYFVLYRVFSDRLVDSTDNEAFVSILSEKLGVLFDQTFHNICPNKMSPIFGELLSIYVLIF